MIAGWWRRSRILAIALIMVWVVCGTLAIAVLSEFGLQARASILRAGDTSPRTRLVKAYDPFITEHLHPFYLFGAPVSAAERRSMANAICSLDRHGFREPSLDQHGTRKLAFLLGGSVAFGLFAGANDTTITAHLNRLQSEYFFVNAGMPGFNSTQELIRLTIEAADFSPALVVSLSGWNDAALAGESWWVDDHLPAATPGSFPTLDEWARQSRVARDFSYARLFPQLSDRTGRLWARLRGKPPLPPATDQQLRDSALRYRQNLDRMHQVSGAIGARFIGVFQPLMSLHQRRLPDEPPDQDMVRFHRYAVSGAGSRSEFHDLGNVFDSHFDHVAANEDPDAPAVFFDEGHLHDQGNEIVARHLAELITLNAPPP